MHILITSYIFLAVITVTISMTKMEVKIQVLGYNVVTPSVCLASARSVSRSLYFTSINDTVESVII